MIEETTGNLLDADVEALVNTVNTVGVMGKGVALQFRQAFPPNYEEYLKACKRGEVKLGEMFVVPTEQLVNPRYIINFPTKKHWRDKARIRDIETGLRSLVKVVKEKGISSVAMPPLGCGSGGLNWSDVRPKIKAALTKLPNVHVLLYAPRGAPEPEKMQVATPRPRMTAARAALVGLLKKYMVPGYRLTMLEVEKLAYFLQCAGVPLKQEFKKGKYGPYTEVLHHVLQRMEGHFIRGYGDRSQGASIRLLPRAAEEATGFLKQHNEANIQQGIERVSRLIEGFETPYGLELLSSIHWAAQEDPEVAENLLSAIRRVHAWNERKRKTFRPEHIEIAWRRLRDEVWI